MGEIVGAALVSHVPPLVLPVLPSALKCLNV